jgi:putative transposase
MPRYRRAFVLGGTFFFTVVTYQRRKFLTTELARNCLRAACSNVREHLPFTIDALVLLPEHLHCIWTLPPNDFNFSTRWQLIKRDFTRQYLASGGVEPNISTSRHKKSERGIWQRRFWEHVCRDEVDMKRCVDYIHLNPVKHRLVERVVDWPWSSFHRYVKLGEYETTWGSSHVLFGDEWEQFE